MPRLTGEACKMHAESSPCFYDLQRSGTPAGRFWLFGFGLRSRDGAIIGHLFLVLQFTLQALSHLIDGSRLVASGE